MYKLTSHQLGEYIISQDRNNIIIIKITNMRRLFFSVVRSLVIIVNLIIATLACLLIYVSFNAFDQDYGLDDSQPRLVHVYASVICAGLGLIVALLTILGLFGAIRKSKSILTTYAAILIFTVSILAIMVIFTYTLDTRGSSYKELDKSIVNSTVIVYNYVDPSDIKTRFIDKIQKSLSCCGLNSPNDWTEYSLHKIPKSCCSEPVESSLPVFKYCAESDYKNGCWKAILDYFHANLASFRTILYTLVAFCVICIGAAFFMIRTLRKSLDVV